MAVAWAGDGRVVADRYELRKELGRGGMGVVWLARDRLLGRDVAIKEVLVPEHLTGEDREKAHARIRREAQTAARIPHPSVITVHDIFDFDGHPWIVMELVRGRTLQDRLDTDGPVPPERVRAIAEAMLGALGAAHETGVIHRDVKPGNIMLAEDGRVVLTDFGIATVDGATALTRTGTLIGSPEYMAPERLEREQALAASDLWSLGATLYSAVEGRSPFHRETLTGTITAVVTMPIPTPERAGDLAPLISGLLDRDVARRLTAEQAMQRLTETEHTRTLRPHRPTRHYTRPVAPPEPRDQPGIRPPRPGAPPAESRRAAPPPVASRSQTAPPQAQPSWQREDRTGPAVSEAPSEMPASLHVVRALLFLGAGKRGFDWLFVLGDGVTYHAGEWLPMPLFHFTHGAVMLLLGLFLSRGGRGLFTSIITVQAVVLLMLVIDLSAGFDLNYSSLLLYLFILVFMLLEPSRDHLLRK